MPLCMCQPPTGYKDTADAWVNTGALVSRMNHALLAGNDKDLALTLGAPGFRSAQRSHPVLSRRIFLKQGARVRQLLRAVVSGADRVLPAQEE
jgi:hypothetical protein